MRTACDELEADFQDLGLWLGDIWTGKLSVRRAAVLASQLKPGARAWQADMFDLAWSNEDYWFAAVIEEIRNNSWLVANRGAKEKDRGPKPTKIDRPSDARKKAAKQAKMELNARAFQRAARRHREAE